MSARIMHLLCGLVAALAFYVGYVHYGWATILGFHAYEVWQCVMMKDKGYHDVWEFWAGFIAFAGVCSALRLLTEITGCA